jgi:multiple sugar transport system permease protein
MPSIMALSIWKDLGGSVIIFLAGLQNIPSMYYDAAAIDGATGFAKFRHITIPLLSPTTFLVFIMSTIGAFKVFTPIYVLTNGGPLYSTMVITYSIYSNAFEYLRMGYSCAVAYILFIIVLVFTLLNFKFGEKLVHYQ